MASTAAMVAAASSNALFAEIYATLAFVSAHCNSTHSRVQLAIIRVLSTKHAAIGAPRADWKSASPLR